MSSLIAAVIVCGTSIQTGERLCHASVYNAIKPGMERCELQTNAAALAAQAAIVGSNRFYFTENFSACYPLEKLANVTANLPKFAKDNMGADQTRVTSYEFKDGSFVEAGKGSGVSK